MEFGIDNNYLMNMEGTQKKGDVSSDHVDSFFLPNEEGEVKK